jgi:hypothetical protein
MFSSGSRIPEIGERFPMSSWERPNESGSTINIDTPFLIGGDMRHAKTQGAEALPALLALILALSGCHYYVGVEWVVDYSAVGKYSVPGRDDCATGFYDVIRSCPNWAGKFNRGDADAWEKHFKRESKGGIDTDWIDDVDFAYFAGHGAGAGFVETGVGRGGGFTLGRDANDDWVLSAAPDNREPRLGDHQLEWIVLDVCSALALKSDGDGVLYTVCERWSNSDVMRGLHYILGFRTPAYDSYDRGRIFAEYLTGARDGVAHTIRDAWRKATEDTEGSPVKGAYLRAYSPGRETFDDHLHGFGSVSEDPDPVTQSYVLWSWQTW